jgi:hypothetical protein
MKTAKSSFRLNGHRIVWSKVSKVWYVKTQYGRLEKTFKTKADARAFVNKN